MKYVILLKDKSLFVGIDGGQVISTTDSREVTLIQSKAYLDSLVSVLQNAELEPEVYEKGTNETV